MTKKQRVRFTIDDDTFVTGKPGIGRMENGFRLRSAQFRLADGSIVYGAVDLCERDSGEHYGTYIVTDQLTVTSQGDDDFCEQLNRTSDQVFPYRYRYYDFLPQDHHVGDDGWSQ
jgi:hypothetical protein